MNHSLEAMPKASEELHPYNDPLNDEKKKTKDVGPVHVEHGVNLKLDHR